VQGPQAFGRTLKAVDLGVVGHRFTQRFSPVPHQGVHTGLGHKVRVFGGAGSFKHVAQWVEHAHGVGTPWAANFCGAGHGLDGEGEARVAHGEVLGAVVKRAEVGLAGGHASACTSALFKHMHMVASFGQSAGCGDASNAGSDDGDV
jgi:hypothetical protein